MQKLRDNKAIIVALDYPDADSCLKLLDQLDPSMCRTKVGKQLFTRCGPDLVQQVQQRGFDVFLDLKFHDIPNTVAGAVRAAAELGVWMLNVHASGGRAMLEAAAAAGTEFGIDKPLLIAVTVLTSMAQEDLLEVGISATPSEQVKRLAVLSEDCGLDGVVCSAAETSMLRSALGEQFCLVTPGIRRQQDATGDQKRIVAPADAIGAGSNYLVVGRPITQAISPQDSLHEFYAALSGVL